MYTLKRLEKCIRCNDYRGIKSIDKDMIPILIELNEKGYETMYCCSGHIEEIQQVGSWNAYLTFGHKIKIPTNIPLYEATTKTNAKGKPYSKIVKNAVYWNGSCDKKMTIGQKEYERKQLMNDLLEWARGLPEYECRNN